jgi:hypothetical protein
MTPKKVFSFDNRKDPSVRDYIATAIVGDKRQGKTVLSVMMIEKYRKLYPDRKILILDVSDTYGEKTYPNGDVWGYKEITLEELQLGVLVKGKRMAWARGVRRIRESKDFTPILTYMEAEFKDGLLVLDESTTVFSDNPTDERKALLITHTNHRVDIICIFHQLFRVPKRLRGQFWQYVFFKTSDGGVNPKQLGVDGFPDAERFYLAWKEAQDAEYYDTRMMQSFSIFRRQFKTDEQLSQMEQEKLDGEDYEKRIAEIDASAYSDQNPKKKRVSKSPATQRAKPKK